MRKGLIWTVAVVSVVSAGAFWLSAAPMQRSTPDRVVATTPEISQASATQPIATSPLAPEPPEPSTTGSVGLVQSAKDTIQSGTAFHVYFPASLPYGYTVTTALNVHIHGGAFYRIDGPSNDPEILVNEGSVGSQFANHFYIPDELLRDGSDTSTVIIGGQTAYYGVEEDSSSFALTVLLFNRPGVDIQLSSIQPVDSDVLVSFANVME